MKCAIYCRVSTPDQKEKKTIESQELECRECADKQGWKIFDIYKDDGVSGKFIEGRDEFQRLLRDIEGGKIKRLLMSETSRMTRSQDAMERGLIIETCKQNGVLIHTPTGTEKDLARFGDELIYTIESMFDAEEAKKIVRRMERGKRRKIAEGQYIRPSIPYGLKRVNVGDDKNKVWEMHLDEEEYPILREIYDSVVIHGQSHADVCRAFNKRRVKTRRNKKWVPGMISSLFHKDKEHTLTGTLYCNRWSFEHVRDEASGKVIKKKRKKPRSEWIPIKIPKMFTKEELKRLHEAAQRHKVKKIYNHEKYRFLLEGKLRCGLCGSLLTKRMNVNAKKYLNYYMCRNMSKNKQWKEFTPCSLPYVHAELIDRRVENYLFDLAFLSTDLAEWVDSAKITGELEKTKTALSKVRAKTERNELKWTRLLDRELSGKYPDSVVEREQVRLEAESEALKKERERLKTQLNSLHEVKRRGAVLANNVDALRETVGRIESKLVDMSFEDKHTLMRLFVPDGSFIDVYPVDHMTIEPDGVVIMEEKAENPLKPTKDYVPGSTGEVLVKWAYLVNCSFDAKVVIGALKQFDERGHIDPRCLDIVYSLQCPDEQPPDQKVLYHRSSFPQPP